MNDGVMLNAYPDSLGAGLRDTVALLKRPEFRDAFRSFYILPSLFRSDLDRGFSVISYDLEPSFATEEDLDALRGMGIDLKLDFVLNHLSVQSPPFQDLLRNGDASVYRDFFIDWNRFWSGLGEMGDDGVVRPRPELIRDMFFRKPGLPVLKVRFPDGTERPYWNTFYQEIRDPAPGETVPRYLGQMDLNLNSPLVWDYYSETLDRLAGYGAALVRLDAFAYACKAPGRRNFLNEPGTWDALERLRVMGEKRGLTLLPEIHDTYESGTWLKLAEKGYRVYDFFLPGLLIDALERGNGDRLRAWAEELRDRKIRTVNMLGCHDGIPLLDLKGILPEERIAELTDLIVSRGGKVKDLHGAKNVYYQVNATYYSALGADPAKLLLARAIQMFMPGKPQVWYLDLFAGENDLGAVARAGAGGHKEINRTNLTAEEAAARSELPIVQRQLELMRLRNTHPALAEDAELICGSDDSGGLTLTRRRDGVSLTLRVDLKTLDWEIK